MPAYGHAGAGGVVRFVDGAHPPAPQLAPDAPATADDEIRQHGDGRRWRWRIPAERAAEGQLARDLARETLERRQLARRVGSAGKAAYPSELLNSARSSPHAFSAAS